MAKILAISGFFYRDTEHLAMGPTEEGIGPVVVKYKSLPFAFSGVLFPNRPLERFTLGGDGVLQDRFGESDVNRLIVSSRRISFVKRYSHRSDSISYDFVNESSNIWIGRWERDAVGQGKARAIITEVDETFLLPPE